MKYSTCNNFTFIGCFYFVYYIMCVQFKKVKKRERNTYLAKNLKTMTLSNQNPDGKFPAHDSCGPLAEGGGY